MVDVVPRGACASGSPPRSTSAPRCPTDIDAVYVVGIGGGDPGPLLTAQADSGRLGIVAPGSPTSTVDGEAAVSLGRRRHLAPARPGRPAGAGRHRRRVRPRSPARPPCAAWSAARPTTRRSTAPSSARSGRRCGATRWPTSGASATQADELGLWAAANLVPEGPLPSMRIEDQPYGLLPATSLRRWRDRVGDPAIEARLVPLVRQLVDTWAAAAERQAAQQQADALRDLVRNPTATRYAWRWMMPTTLAHARVVPLQPGRAGAPTSERGGRGRRARRRGSTRRQRRPASSSSVGWRTRRRAVAWSSRTIFPRVPTLGRGSDPPRGGAGRRAARRRTRAGRERRHRRRGARACSPSWRGTPCSPRRRRRPPRRRPAARASSSRSASTVRTPTQTETWALRLQPTDVSQRDDPTVGVRRNVVDGTEDPRRARRRTTSTAACAPRSTPRRTGSTRGRRPSPGAGCRTSPPRRGRSASTAGSTRRARGRPTATTASCSRRRPSRRRSPRCSATAHSAIPTRRGGRWTSPPTPIRGALAAGRRDDARAATRPSRWAEWSRRIVNRPDVIDRLRAAFPTDPRLRSCRDLRMRRVCDGAAVLDAAENRPAELQPARRAPRAAHGAGRARRRRRRARGPARRRGRARRGQGTHRPPCRRRRAAAAGQAPPPEFDVVRTPTSGPGRQHGRRWSSCPTRAAPTGSAAEPGGASPTRPSPPTSTTAPETPPARRGRGRPSTPNGAPAGTVTLAGIGLRPCDTVGLGTGNLRDVVRDVSGAAALGPADPPGHATVRALAAALAGVPARRRGRRCAARSRRRRRGRELARRYTRRAQRGRRRGGRRARSGRRQRHRAARRRATLGRMARWGITPLAADVADPTVGELADRVRRAAEALERRIADAPATLSGADRVRARRRPSPRSSRRRARCRCSPACRPPRSPACAPSRPPPGSAPRLDPDWLETVAPVRPALARLEAVQLGQRLASGGRPLRAWTNRPGDPWQTVAAAAVGHRGRAAVAPRRRVRPARRAARRGRPRRRRERWPSP